jgi:carbon monoxide dehydrogenase subunit G
MTQVQRTFTVDQPIDIVVGYLKDFAHAESWDPGTLSCTQTSPGEVRVGTTWHNVSKVRGRTTELTYQLTYADPHRLTFVGTNKTATSTDDMTFEAIGDTTSITYQATVTLNGLAKLAEPLMRREFEKLAGQTVDRMTKTLEGLPKPGSRARFSQPPQRTEIAGDPRSVGRGEGEA